MRFFRNVKGCRLIDKINRRETRNDLNIERIPDEIKKFRMKRKEFLRRMTIERIPQTIFILLLSL